MKRIRIAGTLVSLLVLFILNWSASGLSARSDSATSTSLVAAQLLVNPDMEQAFVPYENDCAWEPCQVAWGWSRFWDNDLEPCWMDARDFAHNVMNSDWVERIKGDTSQVIFSTEPYEAGIYQQVSGLTPGSPYGFTAAMLTIYESSANPRDDGKMIKQVGMDPTGGTDPDAPSVVWSEPDGRDKIWDLGSRAAVVAASDKVTAFIRVDSPYGVSWPYVNQSFLDGALLAQTATAWISASEVSLDDTFVVDWGASASAGAEIWAYDVQWQDLADGAWHNWIQWDPPDQALDSIATFRGERGHSYRFRVRAWQYYLDGDNYLYSPWVETAHVTTIASARLAGKVLGNGPYGFGGARVSVSGTGFEAVSRPDGGYAMWTEPMDASHEVTISNLPWLSPAPVYGVTFGVTETVTLDWSLRPPDDAVENGGFEQGLAGWATIFEQGAMPAPVDDTVHTGRGAVMLGGEAEVRPDEEYCSGIMQTTSLARSWNPNLAFWYLAETADDDDQLSVTLTVLGDPTGSDQAGRGDPENVAALQSFVIAPAMDAEGWQHAWYSLGAGDAYFTGTVTIQLEVWNDGDGSPTTVFLDEVSLGRTPGGPFRTYLPLVGK